MINKIIHQIWVGKYPLPERETRLSKELKEKHPNYEYHLWTDDNLPEIPERLKDMYELMYSKKDYVYCADMLRWLVVYQYGGWYLDIDWEFIQSLDSLNINNGIAKLKCILPGYKLLILVVEKIRNERFHETLEASFIETFEPVKKRSKK